MKKKLLIIGGGFAGIKLCKELHEEFDIILVDENKYHIDQIQIHRYLSSKIDLEEFTFSFDKFAKLKNIKFINEKICKFDFEKKQVFSKNNTYSYDYLVISNGAKTFFPKQIKNIEKHNLDIKVLEKIKEFKKSFYELIEDKKNEEDKNNIVIAGGGLSGVEIAIELAEVIKQREIKNVQVYIIEQVKEILPNMNIFLQNRTNKALDDFNVKRIHGSFITSIENNSMILSSKQSISFSLCLFVLGVSGEFIENKQSIKANVKNQYIVNDYLQVAGFSDVFCLGDAAQTYDANNHYSPTCAQIALKQAKYLAQNLRNIKNNKKMIKQKISLQGILIDLGGKNTIGLLLGMKISSLFAYYLKRFTSYLHKKDFY